MPLVTVYFGVFGDRDYGEYLVVDADLGAALIVCRWCVGEDEPDRECAACKNTRRMWIGI
jgi:hypothetical protein